MNKGWLSKELEHRLKYDEWIRFHPITGQLEIKYLDWNEVKHHLKDLYNKGWVCIS